jgi:hypothetical protein
MTDTIDKIKKLSVWNLALQEFNKDRIPGSKFIMPKKDTPEYLKVKEISNRLKQQSTSSTTVVEKKKVVRKKKEKPNEVVPVPVPTDSASEAVTKPKRTRKKKDVAISSDAQTV